MLPAIESPLEADAFADSLKLFSQYSVLTGFADSPIEARGKLV